MTSMQPPLRIPDYLTIPHPHEPRNSCSKEEITYEYKKETEKALRNKSRKARVLRISPETPDVRILRVLYARRGLRGATRARLSGGRRKVPSECRETLGDQSRENTGVGVEGGCETGRAATEQSDGSAEDPFSCGEMEKKDVEQRPAATISPAAGVRGMHQWKEEIRDESTETAASSSSRGEGGPAICEPRPRIICMLSRVHVPPQAPSPSVGANEEERFNVLTLVHAASRRQLRGSCLAKNVRKSEVPPILMPDVLLAKAVEPMTKNSYERKTL